ncbi:MAG: GAF domain-containing protein, partial [candidate division KSB1 bacterium]|nr:GAF domain-containing protein [candidate division KSB1 bacterium]
PFHLTPAFKLLNLFGENGGSLRGMNLEPAALRRDRILMAYSHILRRFYDVDTQFEHPLLVTTADPQTGLARHYQIDLDLRFVEIKKIGEPVPLSAGEIRRLLAHPTALAAWYELIPPSCFEFHGFAIFTAREVTGQHLLSSLKHDLLAKHALREPAQRQAVQEKLRALLRRPGVQLGLAAIPGTPEMLLEHGRSLGGSFILSDVCRQQCDTFAGSLYEHALQRNEIVIVENLEAAPAATGVERALLQQGIRNIFVAPLQDEGKLVGLLELGSALPGDLHAMNVLKLHELLPFFAAAVKRSLEELNERVEAVIQEHCTALHPVVAWRFHAAALACLRAREAGLPADMAPVVFREVYPLFGLSDVRNSTTQRQKAIRADLTGQLQLARQAIRAALGERRLPFLAQLENRLNQHLETMSRVLNPGGERDTLEFLRHEVEPCFEPLQEFSATVREHIAAYRAALDPALGCVYRQRRDFEDSLTRLNQIIGSLLVAQQEKAQAIFPHYFEKYQSDGIAHVIYLGAALVEQGGFNPLYLKNIRLWQLLLMCGAARLAEAEKPKLKVPLEMTHLILVQNTPLTIRFRHDEKRFDLEGACLVPEAFMKQRIDKALIKGTHERLTQPGRLAIVYRQPAEAAEYREYLDYLRTLGEVTGPVEELELEELDGLPDLRALRVQVQSAAAPSPAQEPTRAAAEGTAEAATEEVETEA